LGGPQTDYPGGTQAPALRLSAGFGNVKVQSKS
jgi:hypothetical protein